MNRAGHRVTFVQQCGRGVRMWRGRGRRQNRGRGRTFHFCYITVEVRAPVVAHVINHSLMMEDGQRLQPNVWRSSVNSVIQTFFCETTIGARTFYTWTLRLTAAQTHCCCSDQQCCSKDLSFYSVVLYSCILHN